MKQIIRILGVFAFTFILWGVFAVIWNHPTVPSPWQVLGNFPAVIKHHMLANIAASFLRILWATLLALALGLPLGLIMGCHKGISQLMSPLIYFSYPVPKLALLPILMLILGLGEISKILMIFLIIFFPIVMDVNATIRAMDEDIFHVMRSFGLSGPSICFRVILPGLTPAIFNSLKVTTGIALSVLFFAENYGTTEGMGYFIMNSWQKMDYVDLYTGVLILAILGFVLFYIFDFLERKVAPWK